MQRTNIERQSKWREKDFANARLKKQKRVQYFRERYNKTKGHYKFPNEINMEKHFYFPKLNVFNEGCFMSLAAMQVYPVLCSRADFQADLWFQLPQNHIADMAGVSINTARKGLEDLMTGSLVKAKLVTQDKRHYYIYRVKFIRNRMMEEYSNKYFIFHTCIIDSGIWSKLKPRSKALYLAFRSEAKFDEQAYIEIELGGNRMDLLDFDYQGADYRNRKWDVFAGSLTDICNIANIERSNLRENVEQLEQYKMIEKVDRCYMVYLKPICEPKTY